MAAKLLLPLPNTWKVWVWVAHNNSLFNSPTAGSPETQEGTAAAKAEGKKDEAPQDWPSLSNITVPSSTPSATPSPTPSAPTESTEAAASTADEPENVGSTGETDTGEADTSNEVRRRRLERFTKDDSEPNQETMEKNETDNEWTFDTVMHVKVNDKKGQ